MGKKPKKKMDLIDIQEAVLKHVASLTDDGFEALKALVWAAQDMSAIFIRQKLIRMGDEPVTFLASRMVTRKQLEEHDPDDLLRFLVEFAIEIRRKSGEDSKS